MVSCSSSIRLLSTRGWQKYQSRMELLSASNGFGSRGGGRRAETRLSDQVSLLQQATLVTHESAVSCVLNRRHRWKECNCRCDYCSADARCEFHEAHWRYFCPQRRPGLDVESPMSSVSLGEIDGTTRMTSALSIDLKRSKSHCEDAHGCRCDYPSTTDQ